MQARSKHIINLIIGFVFCGFPFVFVLAHSIVSGGNLFLSKPHNSDEVCYWRVLYSFANNAFDFASTCGYVGREATVGPLGEHGLATLFSWSGLLLFKNMNEYSIFIYNIVLLSFGLSLVYFMIKPPLNRLISILVLIFCNGIVLEQWYSHMMELPCISIIIICIVFQIKFYEEKKKLWFLASLFVTIYLSYMRICYIVIFFPIIVALCIDKKFRYWLLSLAAYLGLFSAIYVSGNIFMKKSESFLTDLSFETTDNKIGLLMQNAQTNLRAYFDIAGSTGIEVAQRYFQVLLIVILIVSSIIHLKKREINRALLTLVYAMSLFVLIWMMIILYDVSDYRDVRTTMPLTIGVGIWYILTSSKVERIFILIGCVACFFLYIPEAMSSNHPQDRYVEYNVDLEWVNQIENKNTILCLYNIGFDDNLRFQLYKSLPPRIGVLEARNETDLLTDSKIRFIVTAYKDTEIPQQYILIAESKDYGFIYKRNEEY